MGTRTISLDFLKQTTSMNGAVTRRGEWGEELRVIPYENGTRMAVNVNNSSAYLKGVTPDGKYCEIKGQVTGTSTDAVFRFFLTKDWNSAAGNFQVAYVEFKNEPNIITSTVNLDWYVLDNATITDSDSAHYIDELQELIDRLQQQANDFMDRMATQLQGTQDKLDQLDQDTNTKINEINQRLTNINIEIANALEEFRNGDFYTKTEADNRFMKKGEVPDTIQKFKLTADDGQPLPIPSGVTSFGDLAKYTGYFYVPRATAITYTDHDSLPINFRNSGLFVYMPFGQPTNAYRYQEIRLNSTTFARGAFRNTNGVSTTPWVEFANEASITTITNNVSDQGRRIATNAMNITTNTNNITTLQQHDKIFVYKEVGLPNYGANWAGVNAPECRWDFKRVGNRVTMNARMNISDVNKFLGGGTGTMDQIYTIPVGFRQEQNAPFYSTPISTAQWAYLKGSPRNYQGVVEQVGKVRWTTEYTGNHYLTATYFTEDPFPTEGTLGNGKVQIMTQNDDGSIEFGGDW